MKISLITIKGLYNYGAVLQNYATYEYLKKNNHDVEVINYYPSYFEKEVPKIKRLLMLLLTFGKRRKIGKFLDQNVIQTKKIYRSAEDLKLNPPSADIYIVGSDQVWNSQLSNNKIDPAYLLDFVKEGKKIAFSSSIGRTDVVDEELSLIKKHLDDFSSISVREKSAKLMLEKVGLKNVVNVLDPVFLLNKEDYLKFVKKVKFEKYLLIYSFEKNPLIDELAEKISKRLGLIIIELGTFRSQYSNDIYLQNIGIEGFLSLIFNADFVLTSSFHGTSFSLLLNKQFISIAPSMRQTRLENITQLFGVSDRLVSEKTNYIIDDLIKPINYNKINIELENNANKSRSFLKNAVG